MVSIMADDQGDAALHQTKDNHNPYEAPSLKSPTATTASETPSLNNVNENNSAESKSSDSPKGEQEIVTGDNHNADHKEHEDVEMKEDEDEEDLKDKVKQGDTIEKEKGMEVDEGEEASDEEDDESGEEDDDEEGSDDEEVGSDEEESDEEEGESGDEEGDEEEETSVAEETELSDSEVDKCPVCLCPFSDQDVGTPENCDHTFCLECILEWSKNVNTCPVDRSIFRAILVRHSIGGEVVRSIDVDEAKPDNAEEEDPTYCEVCGRCDREDRLLLCDGCDAGYHCECLEPPLANIPVEEWFCPECVTRNRHQGNRPCPEITEAEVGEESEDEWTTIEHRPNVARAIARTSISERVRAVITRARAQRQIVEDESRPKTSRRRATPRKKKTKRKRKRKTTKSRATGKTGKTKKKKGVRRKRKTTRRKAGGRTVRPTPSTARSRIVKSLSLVKPRSGSIMPDKKVPVKKKHFIDYKLNEIGAAKLSLTGDNGLYYCSDEDDKPSTSSKPEPAAAASSSSVPDLLGSIMAGQSILHMKSSDVTIHRDGHLSVNKEDGLGSLSKKGKKTGSSNNASKESDSMESGNETLADGDNSKPAIKCEEPLTQNDSDDGGSDGNQSPMDQDGDEDSDVAAEPNDRTEPSLLDNVPENPGHKILDKITPSNPREKRSKISVVAKKDVNFVALNNDNNSIPQVVNLAGYGMDVDDRFSTAKSAPGKAFEIESDTSNLLSLDKFVGDNPLINPNKVGDLNVTGGNEESLLGQEHDGETPGDSSTVCNVNNSNTLISSTSTEQLEEVDENVTENEKKSKEKLKDDDKNGADEKTIEESIPDKEEEASAEPSQGDSSKSVAEISKEEETKSDNDATVKDDADKVEDVEVIQAVKSARTVTRQSIPGKNPSEAGEIEIIKVDIINKPKRKDKRKKGDKKGRHSSSRHASSSSFDSQSDEEGAIPEKKREKVSKKKKKSKESSKHHQGRDGDAKGKKMGDSTAEEGEVKSDDERVGGKKKKKKKKKNKDSRNVIMDNPKMLIPELGKVQKVKLDGKKSDSESGKSRERGGAYGDLRQVIQVKRDSHPEDEFRRFDWNEFGKRRGDERRVESATNQWEQLYSYSGYGFGESKKWENFTVQRDRSPIYDRRKEKEHSVIKRGGIEPRRASRGGRERNITPGSRDRHNRPAERETLAEKAIRLERESAKRERQLQDTKRGGGHLTMAEREARELMKSRMDEHIERKYGKQGFLAEIKKGGTDAQKFNAKDKHGRERSYDQHDHRENSKDKSRDRDSRLKEPAHPRKDQIRDRKKGRRQQSQGSRSRDEYSSDRHRSMDKRSFDSDMSRSSSRSRSELSDKEEPDPNKALPKTSTVPKTASGLPGHKSDGEVAKKKKKEKTKGKKDKKDKAAKKAAKKANKANKALENKEAATTAPTAPLAVAKRPAESQASSISVAPAAKKQKKIKGKKDKKKKKAAKLAKLAAKSGAQVPAPRPTCLIQDDEDPDVIDLTGEIDNRSLTPSSPPTPKPATPTKPPPKDPSPIVSSTADIRNNPSSILYDPFEPTASPPVSYSNSASPMSSEGNMDRRKDPSSSSMRVSRGSADREGHNSSKRPYSPRDAPRSRLSRLSPPPQATSSSTTTSIAKLLPALSSQTNSQINQLLGSISKNPALQSVLSGASGGSAHGTSLSGSMLSPNTSETSFTKGLDLDSPPTDIRRPTQDLTLAYSDDDEIEDSAVDLYNKNSRDRYLKKLHHQERVVEEVKLAIKPHYQRREINKDEYKEILRKSVSQICHSKSGEINPVKIRNLIDAYVKKALTKRKLGPNVKKPLIITSTKSRSSMSETDFLGKLLL